MKYQGGIYGKVEFFDQEYREKKIEYKPVKNQSNSFQCLWLRMHEKTQNFHFQ